MCRTMDYDSDGNAIPGSEICPWESRGGYKNRLSTSDYSSSDSIENKKETLKFEHTNPIPIFYRKEGKGVIVFYSSYLKSCYYHATQWCKSHCFLKNQPFSDDIIKEIENVQLEKIDDDNIDQFQDDIIDAIKDEKYITLFASGCIENLGDFNTVSTFIRTISMKVHNKNKYAKVRFFIRNPNCAINISDKNVIVILSIDNCTDPFVIKTGLTSNDINGIAIIDHKDNSDIINLLTNPELKNYLDVDVKNIVKCKDCKGNMLCFKQESKFILIQEYQQ